MTAQPTLPDGWNGRTLIVEGDGAFAVTAVHRGRPEFCCRTATLEEAEARAIEIAGRQIRRFLPKDAYLAVKFDDKEKAKKLGARYESRFQAFIDPTPSMTSGLNVFLPAMEQERRETLAAIAETRTRRALADDRIYLDVPFPQKEKAKAAGALFDPEKKQWFVSKDSPLEFFAEWVPDAYAATARPCYPSGTCPYPRYLHIPREDLVPAREAGAVHIPSMRAWYFPAGFKKDAFPEWTSIPKILSPLATFRGFLLRTVGFAPERIYFDGQPHRVRLPGDGRRPSVSYCLYPDGVPAGWVNDDRTGEGVRHWTFSTLGYCWTIRSFPGDGRL